MTDYADLQALLRPLIIYESTDGTTTRKVLADDALRLQRALRETQAEIARLTLECEQLRENEGNATYVGEQRVKQLEKGYDTLRTALHRAEAERDALKDELRRTCEHLGLDRLLADRDAWKIMSGGKQKIIEQLEQERDALRQGRCPTCNAVRVCHCNAWEGVANSAALRAGTGKP